MLVFVIKICNIQLRFIIFIYYEIGSVSYTHLSLLTKRNFLAFTENIFNLLYKYKETRGGKYMIYTVTLNPSIDYVIELDSLNHGSVNLSLIHISSNE